MTAFVTDLLKLFFSQLVTFILNYLSTGLIAYSETFFPALLFS